MKIRRKEVLCAAWGMAIGLINSLFGAGGGLVAVRALTQTGLSQKQAHANAVGVILPITLLSAGLYWATGRVNPSAVLPYLPAGMIGSACGTILLKKIASHWLRGIFGIFCLWAALRLLGV